jgi:uncharacterized protein DUF6545
MLDPRVYDVLYLTCGGLFALVLLHRIWQLLTRRDVVLSAPGWTIAANFASTATAFTFAAPVVYTHVDAALGLANLATLIVYVAITVTSGLFVATVWQWTLAEDVRASLRVGTGIALYCLLAVSLTVLFLLGDNGSEEHALDFDATLGTTGWLAAFVLLYYAGFATALFQVAWTCRRYSRLSVDGWLRRGLRWVWTGALFALGYCALKVVAVVGLIAGWPLAPLSTVWAPMSASLGALLIAVGLTMPGWGPKLTASRSIQSMRQVRDYRRLYPLWLALHEADLMEVMLPPQTGLRGWLAFHWPLRDSGFRLTRRVVEILDGRLALGDFLYGSIPDADSLGHTVAAKFEAAMIFEGIQAKLAGSKPAFASIPAMSDRRSELSEADELRWQVLVSRQFKQIVRQNRGADQWIGGSRRRPSPDARRS